LAIQGLNSSSAGPGFLLSAELSARQASAQAEANVAFNEVAAGDAPGFFVELLNHGAVSASLGNWKITSSSGGEFTFPGGTLAGGAFLALGTNELGFTVSAGDKLFLLTGPQSVGDGVE